MQLIPLADLAQDQRDQIRLIRNQDAVRANMYTTHEISSEEHAAWIERVLSTDATLFFGVMLNGVLVGGASLNAIAHPHQRADWAYYLDTNQQGRGLGAALEFRFLDHVFDQTPIQKLNCEVLDSNQAVIKMHKRFGFVEEGVRRNHILRQDSAGMLQRLDVHLLGITRQEWAAARAKLRQGVFG